MGKPVLGKLDSTCERMILGPTVSIPQTKINSKWIKDVNIRPKTIKLLKGNRDTTHINI